MPVRIVLFIFWEAGMPTFTWASTIMLALALGATSYAQGPSTRAPVGTWEVQHGQLHVVYSFANNGAYSYQRYGSGRDEQESGTFVAQGDRLILRSAGGQQQLRWRIGPDPATAGHSSKPVLFLSYPDGREEFFYPQ